MPIPSGFFPRHIKLQLFAACFSWWELKKTLSLQQKKSKNKK